MKKSVSVLLSLFLALFLADALVSLLDDTLILSFGASPMAGIRGILSLLVLGGALAVYVGMALTPMVPKRFFLPLVLFGPVGVLATIPVSIYHFDRIHQAAWLLSFLQVLLGLGVLFWVQRAVRFRWPSVPEDKLGVKAFSWLNLSGFAFFTVLCLLPGIVCYLALCASLAVDHLSAGFLDLSTSGLAVRARTYQGEGGKTVQLIPMIHVGQAHFYEEITQAIPTNSVTLLEGVTDEQNLLKYKLSYRRMASSLGLAEQQQLFAPERGRTRHADVDIDQFSKSTIEFLNLISRIHAQGISIPTLREWFEKSQSPALISRLWDDLLHLRNEHLVAEIKAELPHTDTIVVPWGAAHMPGVSGKLVASGFHLARSQEYIVIEFRTIWKRITQGRAVLGG